jgi:HPt (histidine-containing phosphotransfer) domain-containing protein
MSKPSIINESRLRQLFVELGEEPEILREVVETFVGDLETLETRLRTALADGDFDSQKSIAHTLKGTAATVGAQWICDAAKALEDGLIAAETSDATLQGGLEMDLIAAIQATPGPLREAAKNLK